MKGRLVAIIVFLLLYLFLQADCLKALSTFSLGLLP